jgi:ATP-dependent Lhr-like helicase
MFQAQKRTKQELLNILDPIVKEWFFTRFKDFSEPQLYGVMPIWERKNILISAPTGGTKTLTAFLSILNYLVSLARKHELEDKVYAVYVSPLKALNNDIEKNLKEPLEEIMKIAEKNNVKLQDIKIAVRTGDTTTSERQKMLKKSPHILITTPETLALIINAPKFSEKLKAVEFMIIDEIHALASNKRGVHLNLSVERLNELSIIKPVRIGLSATIAPLEEIAKFLVGYENGKLREYMVADVQFTKKTDLRVLCPVDNLIDTTAFEQQHGLYTLLDKLIQEHKTTLIFTNTRSATERVINHLKEKFPTKYLDTIGAHHSSLSKELRYNIEERLRKGELKVVVTSTSLELGIDIGYVDLVILLGSPKSVARALQRTGRAGHKLHEISQGRFVILDRDDLVECSVMLKEAKENKIDRIQIPTNCLDVLAQHIYGMAIEKQWHVSEMLKVIKQSYCYHSLSNDDFFSVISYLAGEYEVNARNVYAKIWYDSNTGMIGKKGKLARVIYMTNIGVIPDESFVNVVIATPYDKKDQRVGTIDEGFLERLKKNDVFVLGGHKYQFMYTKGMNIYVNASVQRPPTIPSWFSEMLPLSFDLALGIQRFRKLLAEMFEADKKEKEIKEFIKNYLYAEENTVEAIYSYFYEQYKFAKIPHLNRILVEHWSDSGKHYVLFNTLFGRRVNDALSKAIAHCIGRFGGRDIELGINDNGFFLASNQPMQIDKALKTLNSKNLQEIVEDAVVNTEVFKRRFRHVATRALMLLRNYKGRTKSVGKQQMSSHFLLAASQKTSKDFPILKETKREILEDLMDIENAKIVLDMIRDNKIKVEQISKDLPSPFALNLIIQGHADLMKVEDKIAFLKRMHASIMERIK